MHSYVQRIISISKLALLAGAFALTSCATSAYRQTELAKNAEPQVPVDPEAGYSYWDDKLGDGRLRVTINLSEQTAYMYRGKTLVGRSRVATGTKGHSTPTGSFSIMEKVVDKRSNLYGQILDSSGNVVVRDADSRKHSAPSGGKFLGASMPYWMRLTARGVGMHHGPIPNPGYTASHGCIRMPRHMAESLFYNSSIGTPVTVTY